MRVLGVITAVAALAALAACEKAEDRIAAKSEPKFDVRYCVAGGGDSTIRMPVSGCLISPNKTYVMTMLADGTLQVLPLGPGAVLGKPVWSSGVKASRAHAASMVFQEDGNLVIYEGLQAIWNAGTVGPRGIYHLTLTDDGNLVISAKGGQPVWSARFDAKYCAKALEAPAQMTVGGCLASPNLAFSMTMTPGGALNVTPVAAGVASGKPVWTSGTSGSAPGSSFVALQADGNLVIYDAGKPIWNSQTNGGAGMFRLELSDQGELVLHGPGGAALWSSKTGKTAA